MPSSALDTVHALVDLARKKGADAAEAVLFESTSLSASCRLGKVEDIERSEGRDLGLRVFVGERQAVVSSTDFLPETLEALAERVVAMAKVAPPDPYCGLAEAGLIAKSFPELDLDDGSDISADTLSERAKEAEDAALAIQGVTNSSGAGASFGRGSIYLATSAGFAGSYQGTTHSVSASVLAGEGTGMERDYDFSSARHLSDLEAAAEIGRRAGEKTVRRLGARKVKSQAVPIIYDPRVSNSLLGHFAGAISGSAVARGTSFLQNKMGAEVFAKGITIIDDPLRKRGMRSKPFDGEGVATTRQALVEDGRLNTWLLDISTARQLGLQTTGHASRGTGAPPSPGPTNLYMEAGTLSPEELIADIDEGLYVTEMIGMGVNGVTGDYSRGASGFWIEKGKLTFPVSEITVAGNLKDMFAHLTPASDLDFRYGANAPTLRIEGMTVAGN
ncbi:TldD/PmbA family protein [Tepidicaulis sp. LMO-SS28]|uniref:TldD/PmbA family protein n=1 Tax=Tepidicaulis sp. LMO-SS28 TaxID=3447455 RepID=UPI003EE12A81